MASVLVVDDAADVRFLARVALEAAGLEVSEAAGGVEALEALGDGHGHDLVLLDVQMPGLDGWETLRRIRAAGGRRQLRVVMCTVKGRPEDEAHGWELGCDGYVVKPYDVAGLAELVRALLERDPAARERVRAEGLRRAREEQRSGSWAAGEPGDGRSSRGGD